MIGYILLFSELNMKLEKCVIITWLDLL